MNQPSELLVTSSRCLHGSEKSGETVGISYGTLCRLVRTCSANRSRDARKQLNGSQTLNMETVFCRRAEIFELRLIPDQKPHTLSGFLHIKHEGPVGLKPKVSTSGFLCSFLCGLATLRAAFHFNPSR